MVDKSHTPADEKWWRGMCLLHIPRHHFSEAVQFLNDFLYLAEKSPAYFRNGDQPNPIPNAADCMQNQIFYFRLHHLEG